MFISLDGIDGSGKSTQCRLLAEWLHERGLDVVTCADPGGTDLGMQVRGILLETKHRIDLTCETLLFMASRAQLVAEIIRPALAKGSVVVSDRFLLANVVYQGHGGGLDPEHLYQIGLLATGGLEPDLTLVLDLPLESAAPRRKARPDRIESRDGAYHERVRQGFQIEAAKRPGRVVRVDAALPSDQVQEQIRQEVARVLAAHPRS